MTDVERLAEKLWQEYTGLGNFEIDSTDTTKNHYRKVDAYVLTLVQPLLKALELFNEWGPEWIKEHQKDDHMITLDHKDEIWLADMIEKQKKALSAFQQEIGK